jgi:hypothetical protein
MTWDRDDEEREEECAAAHKPDQDAGYPGPSHTPMQWGSAQRVSLLATEVLTRIHHKRRKS